MTNKRKILTSISIQAVLSLFLPIVFQGMADSTSSIRCYSCTSMNADRLLTEVHDQSWRQWLENIRFVPRTQLCDDPFEQVAAMRGGVHSQPCENGVCLKMWFRERDLGGGAGVGQVWRNCIPNADGKLRTDCTRITSSQGEMEVCTCDGHLCNGSSTTNVMALLMLIISILLITTSEFMVF